MKTLLSLLSAGIIALPARSQQEPPHYKIAADSPKPAIMEQSKQFTLPSPPNDSICLPDKRVHS
ncbi:MAG: hypothetical protein QM743_13330 [Chitinophagaceae bacterium]